MHPRVDRILSAVGRYYEIEPDRLLGRERHVPVSLARQVAIYLLYTETEYRSLKGIGRVFGRDHTTVLYAVRHIEELTATDARIRRDVSDISRLVS